jgi:hypothetical protein
MRIWSGHDGRTLVVPNSCAFCKTEMSQGTLLANLGEPNMLQSRPVTPLEETAAGEILQLSLTFHLNGGRVGMAQLGVYSYL